MTFYILTSLERYVVILLLATLFPFTVQINSKGLERPLVDSSCKRQVTDYFAHWMTWSLACSSWLSRTASLRSLCCSRLTRRTKESWESSAAWSSSLSSACTCTQHTTFDQLSNTCLALFSSVPPDQFLFLVLSQPRLKRSQSLQLKFLWVQTVLGRFQLGTQTLQL